MIPEEIRRAIEGFLVGRQIPWQSINLHVGRLPEATEAAGGPRVPYVLVQRPVTAVGLRSWARNLIAVGMAIGRDVFIAPSHARFDTASGLSLLVHELVHVDQYERDQFFLAKYEEAAAKTPDGRPWENPYEMEAYLVERDSYCVMVAQRVPKGRWVPLGVTLWGCG